MIDQRVSSFSFPPLGVSPLVFRGFIHGIVWHSEREEGDILVQKDQV